MASDDDICRPIDTLNEIYEFSKNPPTWTQLTVTLSRRSKPRSNEYFSRLNADGNICHSNISTWSSQSIQENPPRTLVCHDMNNGYHEDRFVNGSNNHAAYLFYHWAAIDMFIYFSHHFITIPPLGWINVAHKHGVKILGTIITEWENGVKICNEFLKSEEDMRKFVDSLTVIAKCIKLDGWLLNIENEVEKVDELLKFVKLLTDEMHKAIPNSVIIWYDSVIKTGKLNWQNCLNEENKLFFDVCDGIFTNYCWNITHLEKSLKIAGNRKNDVYVGVDIWGRNFWGGGCFNTVEAVKEIYKFKLSMAIFAPGWTHEAISSSEVYYLSKNNTDPCTMAYVDKFVNDDWVLDSHIKKCILRNYFILREDALWNTLWPYLYTRGPVDLPFHTFFCIGAGEIKRIQGKILDDKTWFNLRQQQYQLSNPTCTLNFTLKEEIMKTDDKNRSKRDESDALKNNFDNCTCENELSENSSEFENNEELVEKTVITPVLSTQKKAKPVVKKLKVHPNQEQNGCFHRYMSDSFYGGSCIKICPIKTQADDENNIKLGVITRLLQCEFRNRENYIIYYVVKKLDFENQDLNLILTLQNNETGKSFNVVLSNDYLSGMQNLPDVVYLNPLNFKEEKARKVKENLLIYYPSFYMSTDDTDWKIRYYLLPFPNSTIMEICCKLINDTGEILLGGFGITKDIPVS